jgi:acyl-CoA thioester hydrolase
LRLEVPAQKKLVHEMTVPIRWGDMDTMGHVNNTIYFRYFEISRLDWIFRVTGRFELAGEGPLVVNAFCNFVRQLEFPGELVLKLFVANPGRSSFDTFHTVERVDQPGVVCADGGATTVWTDYAARKAKPMPAWFRAHLT